MLLCMLVLSYGVSVFVFISWKVKIDFFCYFYFFVSFKLCLSGEFFIEWICDNEKLIIWDEWLYILIFLVMIRCNLSKC